jgi:putative phage-type endonuclease
MKIITETQGDAAWLRARCGRITASRMADVMAVLKRKSGDKGPGEPAAARINYCNELVTERLTGIANNHYVSKDMENGTFLEPIARAEYEMATGLSVDLTGFVEHSRLPFSGASPDGLIPTTRGIEIKCPRPTTHIRWRREGGVPKEHQPQMFWTMACCDLEAVDFVSYSDGKQRDWEGKVIGGDMPEELRLYIVPFARDDARIAEMEEEVERMEAEIQAAIASLGLPPNYWAREAEIPPPEDPVLAHAGLTDDDLNLIWKEEAGGSKRLSKTERAEGDATARL